MHCVTWALLLLLLLLRIMCDTAISTCLPGATVPAWRCADARLLCVCLEGRRPLQQ
jgi:hypothetical protein